MQIRNVILLSEVRDDLEIGREFYNQHNVGGWFWDNLISDIKSLKLYAGIHIQQFKLYRMLSQRFPYMIYYDIKDNKVVVVAVLPMKRDPEWIERKIRYRT